MRIRAIELTNLRRFAGQRARIDGIGDGITVLSEPNEFGKSTFFDALHALFFQPHRSQKAPVKALQPHSGGAPAVAVEIDLPEGRFRLEKRWLSRSTARVLDGSGRLIAQEDEAEAWIDRLTGQGLAGPSGLLWVRQGVLGMEPEGASAAEKSERDRALSARRDLLSSVAGEIEMMTGGRRMDQVLARVSDGIARLATATLKPKAGGEWARALAEAEALVERRAELETKAARLTGDLKRRAELQRSLRDLADPETQARDEAALAAAEQALHEAERHAEQVRQAEGALRLAELTAAQGRDGIARLEGMRVRLAAAEADHRAAEQAQAQVAAGLAAIQGDEAAAIATHEAAAGETRDLALRLEVAQRALLAQVAHERVGTLETALTRAGALWQEIEDHRASRAALRVTPAAVAAAEKAQAARDRLAVLAEARLVSVTLAYDGALRVTAAGREIGAGALRLHGATRFDLPGIGSLTVDPGAAGESEVPARLEQADAVLAEALAACGAVDLTAARAALSEAVRLDMVLTQAQALLAEFAPEGLDVLRAALAAVRAGAEDAPEVVEDVPALEAALRAARATEDSALALRREVETRRAAAAERRAGAEAALQGTRRTYDAAQAEAGDPVELTARLLNLAAAQEGLDESQRQAGVALAALRDTAPDLVTAQAAAQRLRSVLDARRKDQSRLSADLAGVNGSIGALADEGIEEALDEVRGREAAALARAARYEREVKALARLRTALDAARREAREAYFGPVLHELEPLLSILHPGAALQIDDESLLPIALTRDGQEEGLDILSGGTREQLAVLTRLAFARLFVRAGRPVPVILDDALVHSDDDRIEAMFTALHRVAQDQQIIVLTCRQRAFASLGGDRLRATVEAI